MILIISHGDGDGVISAAVLKKLFPSAIVKFCKTHDLYKMQISPDVTEIYVTDVGVDRHNINHTLNFAKTHRDLIKLWIDHHHGSERLIPILGDKLWLDTSSPSCPELMLQRGIMVPDDWCQTANASDRPDLYPATELSKLWNAGFRSVLNRQEPAARFQQCFLDYLLYDMHLGYLQRTGADYPEIYQSTIKRAEQITTLHRNIGYIRLNRQASIDRTLLFIEAYKKYLFLIVSDIKSETVESLTIGTRDTQINLMNIFNIVCGSPFKISLRGRSENLISQAILKLKPWT